MSEHESALWFVRSWRGHEPAYKVFWLYGVPINLIFYVSGAIVGYMAATNPPVASLVLILLPIYVTFLVWFCVSLWRCAFNVGWKGWAYLSRVWVTLVVAGISLRLFDVMQALMPIF